VVTALGLLALLVALRRRRVAGRRVALRALEKALSADEPVSLMRVADFSEHPARRPLMAAVRARLRRRDRLFHLSRWELLVIAPDTRAATLKAISSELQEDVARLVGPDQVLLTVIEAGPRSAEEALKRLRDVRVEHLDEIEMTVDSLVLR
jgi:hypothetical protein